LDGRLDLRRRLLAEDDVIHGEAQQRQRQQRQAVFADHGHSPFLFRNRRGETASGDAPHKKERILDGMTPPSFAHAPLAGSRLYLSTVCVFTFSMRPSLIDTMRSPKRYTRLSCVTTITPRSGCTATRRISSITVCPACASSAAVGSSHTSRRG